MPSPLGKVAERSEVGRGRIPWVFPYKSPSAMQALAAESYRECVTAYYDNVLSYKLVRDEGNMEMVELIMDGRMYDFGYVYGAFESHGGGASFWINDIVKGNGDVTSYYQSRKSNWENYMATVYSKFETYEG